MGAEHPFNPIVKLLPEPEDAASEDLEGENHGHLVAPLAHHTFVFTPILAQAALLAREKEANAAASSNSSVISGKSNRTFRRQPPFYVDTMSVSGRSQWSNDPRARNKGPSRMPTNKIGGGSPRTGGGYGGMNYGGGGMPQGQGQTSPMNMAYARMPPGPMMMVAPQSAQGMVPGMVAAGSYPGPNTMVMPMGSPLQQGVPMPVYSQQMQQMQLHYMQQQQQIYQNYQAQMHPSMASSLSSSYGAAHSPMGGGSMGSMAQSPMAIYQQQSYLANVMGAAQPNAPQQQHPHGMEGPRQTSPKSQQQGQQW